MNATPDQADQAPSDETVKPTNPRTFGWIVLIVVLGVGLALLAFPVWNAVTNFLEPDETQESTTSDTSQLASIANLQEEVRRLETELVMLAENQSLVVKVLEEKITDLEDSLAVALSEAELSEPSIELVESLVQRGRDWLALFNDSSTARSLLRMARETAQQLDIPYRDELQSTLGSYIESIQDFTNKDLQYALVALDLITERVDALFDESHGRSKNGSAEFAAASSDEDESRGPFDGLFSFRKTNQPSVQSFENGSSIQLKQQLKLSLSIAQMGALQRDQEVFELGLSNTTDLLLGFKGESDTDLPRLVHGIQKLTEFDISLQQPDLTDLLTRIRGWINPTGEEESAENERSEETIE